MSICGGMRAHLWTLTTRCLFSAYPLWYCGWVGDLLPSLPHSFPLECALFVLKFFVHFLFIIFVHFYIDIYMPLPTAFGTLTLKIAPMPGTLQRKTCPFEQVLLCIGLFGAIIWKFQGICPFCKKHSTLPQFSKQNRYLLPETFTSKIAELAPDGFELTARITTYLAETPVKSSVTTPTTALLDLSTT